MRSRKKSVLAVRRVHGSQVVKKSLMLMIWLAVLWLPVKPCRVVRKAAA